MVTINGFASSAVDHVFSRSSPVVLVALCCTAMLHRVSYSLPVTAFDPSSKSATASKTHDSYPFNLSSATRPPFCDRSMRSNDGILKYPGRVRENILSMGLLNDALGCLDKVSVDADEVQRILEFVRDRLYFPNSTGQYDLQQNNKVYVEPAAPGALSNNNYKRRLPWLNPEDGCMVRAEFMTTWAQEVSMFLLPSAIYKFFLFGDSLALNSRFTKGTKYWYYHVAPLVYTTDHRWLIIDPSINYRRPMLLQDWILSMTNGSASSIEDATNLFGFAITSRFPYWPSSQADATQPRYSLERLISNSYNFVSQDLMWIEELLRAEWTNLQDLGLDPMQLLGNQPPWLMEQSEEMDLHSKKPAIATANSDDLSKGLKLMSR